MGLKSIALPGEHNTMALIVQKYGGTSVGDTDRIKPSLMQIVLVGDPKVVVPQVKNHGFDRVVVLKKYQ